MDTNLLLKKIKALKAFSVVYFQNKMLNNILQYLGTVPLRVLLKISISRKRILRKSY